MTPQYLAENYNFAKINPSDGALELYFDHHMLSTFRMCQDKFVLDFVQNGTGLTTREPTKRRIWSLEFGEFLHYCLEWYYKKWKFLKATPEVDEFIKVGKAMWDKMDMEYYDPGLSSITKCPETYTKKYHAIGGWNGVACLLLGYWAFYMNQRFQVIDTEVAFGFNKEVFLGEFRYPRFGWHESPDGVGDVFVDSWDICRCYLSGRIDLLVDNGYKIGPVDHKSTAFFDGRESDDFNPHEGISGYIFAVNSILKTAFPEFSAEKRHCNNGWIFHVSLKATDNPRFKHSPIFLTEEQMSAYAIRQVETCHAIFDILCSERRPYRNTSICNNYYHRDCEYKVLHRQPDSQQAALLAQYFDNRRPWNPYNVLGNAQEKRSELVQLVEEL